MSSTLRKLRKRSPVERWLLVRATLALAVMRACVGVIPFRTITRALGLTKGESPIAIDPTSRMRAADIGRAIASASAHLPWKSTCLMQALAGAALLRGDHITATLYLGAAKDRSQMNGIVAHAWLRCGEAILTGDAERQHFTPIGSFSSH